MHRDITLTILSKLEKILSSRTACSMVKVPDTSMSYNLIVRARLVQDQDEKTLIIKVSYDVNTVTKDEIIDIVAISRITSAIPMLVGVKEGNEKMREDVAYRKMGVIAMSVNAFKRIVEGKQIRLVKDRGIIKARIRGEELRRRREQLGLSLGDVAEMLKVSRKTVYEYERGTFEASERTARLLMQYFGEDIIEEVSLEPKIETCQKYLEHRKVSRELIQEKFAIEPREAYRLEHTHGKVAIACNDDERYMIIPRRRYDDKVDRIVNILDVKPIINGE